VGALARPAICWLKSRLKFHESYHPNRKSLLRKLADTDHKDVMPHSKSFFEKVKNFFSSQEETTRIRR
jgi:hypothetical protein